MATLLFGGILEKQLEMKMAKMDHPHESSNYLVSASLAHTKLTQLCTQDSDSLARTKVSQLYTQSLGGWGGAR